MNAKGFDAYNQTMTGDVAMTFTAERSDPQHIPCVLIYDARGNGDGCVCPTLTGDHQNRITNYTAIVVEENNANRTLQQPEPRAGKGN